MLPLGVGFLVQAVCCTRLRQSGGRGVGGVVAAGGEAHPHPPPPSAPAAGPAAPAGCSNTMPDQRRMLCTRLQAAVTRPPRPALPRRQAGRTAVLAPPPQPAPRSQPPAAATQPWWAARGDCRLWLACQRLACALAPAQPAACRGGGAAFRRSFPCSSPQPPRASSGARPAAHTRLGEQLPWVAHLHGVPCMARAADVTRSVRGGGLGGGAGQEPWQGRWGQLGRCQRGRQGVTTGGHPTSVSCEHPDLSSPSKPTTAGGHACCCHRREEEALRPPRCPQALALGQGSHNSTIKPAR